MCLSAGDNPVSGSSLTIDHCGNGQKQTWNYSAQNKLQLDSTSEQWLIFMNILVLTCHA